MQRSNRWTQISMALVAAAVFTAPPALTQERPPIGGPLGGEQDPRAELEALFKKVELRLNRMSELLGQASAGERRALEDLGGAGIDELIRSAEERPPNPSSAGIGELLGATRGQGNELLQEIDRVIEIAREQAQQQQSSSSSGQQQQQQQPQGQQPQQGQTPEGSRQMQGEQAPQQQQQGEQPGQEQQQNQPQDGEDPRGNEDNPEVTPEQLSNGPPDGATGAPAGVEGDGQWGDLPVHVRRVFQNGVGEDVPPRYRDWIDSYHRKLVRRR